MSKANRATRREFLKSASMAVAAPYVITTAALGADGRPPASERIVMAGIGIGNMGSGDQGAFLGRGEVQYVAVCDVRKAMREAAKARADKQYGNSDCTAYNDFREVLARKDIDAVHVATPDHWHAIIVVEACRDGKDVYCQKPESRTIREGRLMVEAARRYGRVVSGGSQRVLDDYGRLAEQCWSGELGTIKEVYVNVGGPSRPCNLPGQPVPSGHRLGHVAGAGALGALPSVSDQRHVFHRRHRLALVERLFRRRHDRLGRAQVRRRHVRRRRPRSRPRRDRPARRKGPSLAGLPVRQRAVDLSSAGPGRRGRRWHAGRAVAAQAACRATRAPAASTATSCTASAPAKGRSATSNWPIAPSPFATSATSPTS